MLPPAHRMRRSPDFRRAVSAGRRVRKGTLVLHQLAAEPPARPALVGFVVGRPVGNSVVRHRVTRRLRAVVAARLTQLPPTSLTVVRALPAAAAASSPQLGADLDAALARLGRPAGRSS